MIVIFDKTSVFHKSLDLGLQIHHVFGKTLHRCTTVFSSSQANVAFGLAILPTPPVGEPAKAEYNDDGEDGPQHGQSNLVFREEHGKSQKQEWENEECNKNVDKGEPTPHTCCLPKLPSSIHRKGTHIGNGIIDDDTRNVEEQVTESNLHGIRIREHSGHHDGSDRRSDVSTQGKGVHLFETDDAKTDQRCKGGGSDGRRLSC